MPNTTPPSRRQLLFGAAACAGVPPLGARSARAEGDLRRVSMRLDYLYQGPNGGFIVARDKGFYREVGLDVEVGPGKGGGNTAQLVASGATDFGFADGFVVGDGAVKGFGVQMVGAIYRSNPAAVVVLSGAGVETPKDLVGKTIGLSAGGGTYQQWPAYLKGCGLEPGGVRTVNIDPAGLNAALLTGRVDGIVSFAQSTVPAIETHSDKKTKTLWFADCGVDLVSDGILARSDLIQKDPELVGKFVRASLRGFLYARAHLDEAAAIVKRYAPASDVEVTKRQIELSWRTWVTPNTANKPLGWMSEADWAQTIAVLQQYGGVKEALTPGQLYTNAFIPTEAEFIPPQT